MEYPQGADEIISVADTWYQGARLFPRIGLSKVEQKHPVLERVRDTVLRVAQGEITHTERWGEGQFIIPRMLPTF